MGVVTNLPELREKHGLTQQQLAHFLGVSRQTINSVERGRFEPSLLLALRMASFFARPVEEIFTLDEALKPR
ncbi:MAG TPA: helix-turn-helix transcriptional regulator [Allosphingosinicella sp.]|nr:helix-turn-helix transcriptional regulator [Allosphingosinicella sp.]